MTSSSSLAGRALLAVVLMIGFYILAVAIAAGLIYLPYAEVAYAHRIHPKLAILCVVGALAILWSVLPRFDRFESPGPHLTRDQHPRLFQEIDGVARDEPDQQEREEGDTEQGRNRQQEASEDEPAHVRRAAGPG